MDQTVRVPVDPGRPTRMSFSGDFGAYCGLLIKGSLLLIPTLGFYRFWLTTRVRRHLWANTRLGGEAFEYVGTAKELLIGFLIALAVLVPIYVLYFAAGLYAETLRAFASVPLFLVIYVLAHYASYRARRYRATRTVFRGVRFGMRGSAWSYAGRAILWDLATLFSLGIAYPWRVAALERYKMRNTFFGSLEGDFTGRGGTLFAAILPVALGIAVSVAGGFIASALSAKAGGLRSGSGVGLAILGIGLSLLALWCLMLLSAIVTRFRLSHLRFGAVALSSDLRRRAFVGLYVKAVLSALAWLTIGLLLVAALAFAAPNLQQTLSSGLASAGAIPMVVLMALAYITFLLGFGVIFRVFFERGIWDRSVNSVSVTNLAVLDEVVATAATGTAVGEGLADALDVSGF